MYVSAENIIQISAVLVAIITIFSTIFAIYRWYLKQNKQDDDIKNIKKEMTLICFCMSAVLDGQLQQGCNHTVPEAKKKLDKYLNLQAHNQED